MIAVSRHWPRRGRSERPAIPADRQRSQRGQRACVPVLRNTLRRVCTRSATVRGVIPDQFGQPPADSAKIGAVSAAQFGLLRRLFLGILSTSSGSARSISRRAIRSIKVAVVRPRRSASCAAVSTFWPSLHVYLDMPFLFLTKVRDEKSHICCGAAEEARSSIERNDRKPATVEGFPETCARPAFRNHRTGRTFGDRSFSRDDPSLS